LFNTKIKLILEYTAKFRVYLRFNVNKQLYFISVFIYTCIKVNLTEGEKEMASPKPSRTRPIGFLFWLQKNPKS